MWHAARKQEKMIRVMMVDYQKRAGRRREYYECIKQDPNQFLRVYGRSMKVHIDPALAAVADGPQIMQPWQGDPEVQIDRYDVRSHIDYIAPPVQNAKDSTDLEENRCNYERYRILVQNECAGVSEDQCLQQIYHDELFGSSDSNKSEEDKKRKLAEKKAAIGFIYDDGSSGVRVPDFKKEMEEEVSDEEIDLDNILDIDMLTEEQEQVLNGLSVEYGMEGNDYSEFLQLDRDEMEALRAVKQIEEEKAQFSGRKSRRERRAFKERRLRNRKLSPPSYATKTNTARVPTYEQLRGSSSSRSRSPPGTGVIQFITSFGNNGGRRSSDDEKPLQGPSLPAPRDPNKPIVGPKLPDKGRRSSKSPRRRSRSPRRRSRSPRRRSRSPRRRSRKRSRSNRRSRSRDRNRGRRSRSRSEGRSNGYRRDYSRRSRRSRSLSRSHSRLSSRSPSSLSSCSKPSRSCSRSRSRGSKGTSTQTPIKKYRRSSLSSKSESDGDDGKKEANRTKKDSSGSKSEQNRSVPGKGSVAASKTSTVMTPQERLKRRMQLALTKQFKADKKAQIEKQTKEDQLKQDREEELRLLSAQMRQRDRERRHREREERDRLEAEMDRPARKRSRSSERSRSRKRSRRSSSRGSRSRRSRSRESGSRRSRRRSSPDSARTNRPKLVDY